VNNRMIQIAFSAAAIAFAAGVAHAQASAAAPAAPAAPAAGGAAPAAPAAPFLLTSPDFKDGGMMPAKYGDIRTPACGPEAMKVSPALAWTGTPARAVTLVVTMLDVDAGLGAAHFIAYDIPKDKTSLAAGELLAPKDFVAGTNYRMENYSGPCPPAGPAHHYVITLWATDLAPGTLKPGMTRDQVLAALTGHNVGVANIIGLYQRP
jgi:Raf kinase inhibitor-like YbhB/YbcL family protein